MNKIFQSLLPGAESYLDVADYEIWRRRFLHERLRIVLVLAIVGYASFIVLELFRIATRTQGAGSWWLLQAAASEVGVLLCFGIQKTRWGKQHPEWLFLGCSWSITLVEQIWATFNGFALFAFRSWTLVFLTQSALMPVRWPLHLISQVGVLVYYGMVNGLLGLRQQEAPPFDNIHQLYIFWFCAICNLAVYLYEALQRAEFKAHNQLEAERERSERLLLNILPAPIAQQLKHQPNTIADSFAEASVLFADIVGFTQLSSQIPPVELVNLLNQIFSRFDYLAEQHNLEKIKTIGDAYMVVGGLPQNRDDHAVAIAEMALDMQQAVADFNETHHHSFSIRVGINTGPVVAGVIGVKKFIYDLWGDTVNTASRMESHGAPDRIHVTDAIYKRLKDQYVFEERGEIEVKGKGRMHTYFLVGRVGEW